MVRTSRIVTIICSSLLAASASAQQAPSLFEVDVKAAFVYQFSRYVEWPSQALPSGQNTPFRVCTVAGPAFRQSLQKVLQGESTAGHPMIAVPVTSAAGARQCHILYIDKAELPDLLFMLADLRDDPVLTVSDASDFLSQGGHIMLVRDENRIRFDVNLAAARRAKMTVSAQLLRVARHVITAGGDRPVQ